MRKKWTTSNGLCRCLLLIVAMVLLPWVIFPGNRCYAQPAYAATMPTLPAAAPVNGTPLADTGQTQSFTVTFGEDSDYLINPPSYTKLDANGNDLPDSATSWVMVRDNVTQLIWEVKTDDGSIHDKDNTYTWEEAQNVFIDAVNAEQFAGHLDWRMPTINELASITDLGEFDPSVNTYYFPNTLAAYYWSSTSHTMMFGCAWGVGFNYEYDSWHYKSDAGYVRAVRGGQVGSSAHFVANGDGTVTDTVTGLMWQQGTDEQMSWENAISHCEALSLGGYDDWRLPNRRELRSIVDYAEPSRPAIDTDIFPDTADSLYWQSTTNAYYTSKAWAISFDWGDASYCRSKLDSYYVRAVRGGQPLLSGHLFISSPRQGSFWGVGDTMPILWDTQDIQGNVEISISRQGGKAGTFEAIAESTENDGTYDWTVSGSGSVNCVLQIIPLNDPDKETTQGLFSIRSVPTVTTTAVSAITTTSASSGGEVTSNGGASVTARGVCWSTSANPTISDNHTSDGTGTGSFISDITGLSPGRTYHVRAYATNDLGTGYGSDLSFKTDYASILYVSSEAGCGGHSPCHNSIQEAIEAAETGSAIRITGEVFNESIVADASKSLTLQGGWNAAFTSQDSYTTVNAMTISDGTVRTEYAVIR